MTTLHSATVDSSTIAEIVHGVLVRRPGYLPHWVPAADGPDAALVQIVARYAHTILQRVNQAPDKNLLAFLDLLGIDLVPAQSARAPIVFRLSEQAVDGHAPAGTRVAAPPPPESSRQLVFETERACGLAAARLLNVVSLWPGRDQFVDDSDALTAGAPLRPFERSRLVDTPHALYIAHDTLLALAGRAQVNVEFELTQAGSEPLHLVWEYWDGQVWRGFKTTAPACGDGGALQDGTGGLRRSGRVRLETDCAETSKTTVNGIDAYWIRGRLAEPLPPLPSQILPEVESVRLATVVSRPVGAIDLETGLTPIGFLERRAHVERPTTPMVRAGRLVEAASVRETVRVSGGFLPDKAFVDGSAVDLTTPFYVFGQQPQPGSTFYFTSEEAFTKPGARLEVYVETTTTPQDQFDAGSESGNGPVEFAGSASKTPLDHTVSWEYWNGREWAGLLAYTNEDTESPAPDDFTATDIVEVDVPDDFAETEVNGQKGRWMRVRLLSGGFGFKHEIRWTDSGDVVNRFTNVIAQPPALSAFKLGYTWTYGPFHPQRVLAHNDFAYTDRTDEAIWPGRTFAPFVPVADVTPAVYFGYDKPLPVDRHGLYIDVVEQPGEPSGPSLVWQYWNGISWRELSVEDETGHLRRPGIVSFIAAPDSHPLARFGTPRHWIRARLKEDGPPGAPTIAGLFANAVWAVQRQLVLDEPLGVSSGQPNQVFLIRQAPILPEEVIEVREASGLRANVEWRLVALDVLGGGHATIQALEAQLAQEGPELDVVSGDLRLRRDRQKRVAEVWVRWRSRPRLLLSGANDRHYTTDRVRGRLQFGDGIHGRVPPVRAAVLARRYHTGGGLSGNVAAGAISQALAAVPGVERVFNPRAAEGGANAETLETIARRGPRTLRHRGRAIGPADYETMAYEASPAVAVAYAMPARNAAGRPAAGWVSLVIIPDSADPRPWPSFGLREQVRRFIESQAPADVAAARRIHVTGPSYLPIDLDATLVSREPAEGGAVERRAREALLEFFHPLRGGPDRRGWPMGRDVHTSDVASLLESVEGIDHVRELALLVGGVTGGDRVRIADERTVVAGTIRLKVM